MTYGQIKDQVLKLLNQYTIAGNEVANSYNNQQDYLNRIPSLVNDAIMEIATTTKKIRAILRLEDLFSEDIGNEIRYELPTNFFQWVSGGVVRTVDGRIIHSNVYSTQGKTYIIVPKEEAGEYSIEYYRYPMLLAEQPDDMDELDNTPETHHAIPYYVAGMIASHDDQYIGAILNNKYDDLCNKMQTGLYSEVAPVSDSYSFYGGAE